MMIGVGVKRLIVGISGASCTGKTTLVKLLKATFPWASVIHQDAYYHPNDPRYHVYLPDIKHFNWDAKSAVDFPQMEKDLEQILLLSSTQRQIGYHKHNNSHLGESECTVSQPPQLDDKLKEQLLCCPNNHFVQKHRPPDEEVNQLSSRFSAIPLTLMEGNIVLNHIPFYKLCSLRYFLTLDQTELFDRRQRREYDPPNPPGYVEKYVWPAYVSRLEESMKLPDIKYYDAKSVELVRMYREIRENIALEMTKLSMSPPGPTITTDGSTDDGAFHDHSDDERSKRTRMSG